jgi:transcriptional repressor NrdR
MVCIYCQRETKVVNSRPQKRLNRVWRRRTCQTCGVTFTSSEAVDLSGSITVRGTGHLEPFQRDKLFMSVYDSLKHRKTALSDATSLTDTIISKMYPDMKNAIINTTTIKLVTSAVLKNFDRVAMTHYTAFHPVTASTKS